jgi:hypothetical protein
MWDGVDPVPARYLQGNQAEAAFGGSVAFAGDVNGDGFSDVIIGASLYDSGQEDEGRAYVYHGSASGIGEFPAWHAASNYVEGLMGSSVSPAGDVNRDGYADVLVGASMFTNGQLYEGKAYVWHGSADGVNGGIDGSNSNADWSFECNQVEARLGYAVSTAGDVNGDGYSDVIVAAPYYTDGETGEGAAWIFHGSSTGVSDTWDNMDVGNQISAHFGMSVAMAGDVNGDGYGDVIVGAPDYTLTESEEGRAFVWYGHAGGISSTRDWDGEGGVANTHYGHTVATAGDVNGDGYSEIFIAAQGDTGAPG